MFEIFDNNILEQPNDDEFLYRFIKPERIDSLLKGEIYFAQLFEYEDYYEAITPIHHLIIQARNRIYDLEFPNWENNSLDITEFAKRSRFSTELLILYKQLNAITKISDENKLIDYLNRKIIEFEVIQKEHINRQRSILCNCWFIGDLGEESALMWNSYSIKGGLAIRIRFKEFKFLLENYFYNNKQKVDPIENVKTIKAGKVIYRRFNMENDWISDIEKGIPLSFFKHSSYKNENEYRIIIETDEVGHNGKSLNVFHSLSWEWFDVILHPSSTRLEMNAFKKLVSTYNINPKISFSKLSYRREM
jgi:hypothetical protein